MKKILKTVTALVLVAALALSLSGCYSENKTWAAEYNGQRMPIGVYIYYLNTAYNEAAAQVSSEQRVLSATLDGKPAEQWIRDRAMEYLKLYFWTESELDRLGVTVSEEALAQANTTTESYWALLQTSLENFGVSKSSFDLAYSQYTAKSVALFNAYYGAGGEKEVPYDEVLQYYTDHYYSYEYFTAPYYNIDEDGNYTFMEDEEKEALNEHLETYVAMVNDGNASVQLVAGQYAADAGLTSSTYNSGVGDEAGLADNYLPDEFIAALMDLEEGGVTVVATSSSAVLLRRRPLEENLEEMLDIEDNYTTLLMQLRGEEFEETSRQAASAMEGVTLNTKAIDGCSLSAFVKAHENGTLEENSGDDATADGTADENDGASDEEAQG